MCNHTSNDIQHYRVDVNGCDEVNKHIIITSDTNMNKIRNYDDMRSQLCRSSCTADHLC